MTVRDATNSPSKQSTSLSVSNAMPKTARIMFGSGNAVGDDSSSSRTNALAQQILWESLLVYHHKSFYWAAGITVTVDGINTSRVCRNPITTNQCTTNNQLPVVNSFDPSFSAVGILAGRLFSLHPFRRKIFQSFSESIQFFASVV